jgi:hypothetical protein
METETASAKPKTNAQPDLPVPLERVVWMDYQVFPELTGFPEKVPRISATNQQRDASIAQLDPKEQLVLQANQESEDNADRKDLQDSQEETEIQEPQESKVLMEPQETMANQDNQETKEPTLRNQLAAKETVDPQDPREEKVQSVTKERTEPKAKPDPQDQQDLQDSLDQLAAMEMKAPKAHLEAQDPMLSTAPALPETVPILNLEVKDLAAVDQETEVMLAIMVLALVATKAQDTANVSYKS